MQNLIKAQFECYSKKYALEKGQFHQCIPNPNRDPNRITTLSGEQVLCDHGIITVQLVKKVLHKYD